MEENGFDFSRYVAETDDGYVLNLFRVRNKEWKKGDPAILLMHDMLDTADAFILNHPDQAPAFVWASKGYDVWLGNQRGSMYSRGHTKLIADSTDSQERKMFFDFSFKEMGDFDLPAMIDKVLEVTDLKKISYVGHGQGAT